MTQDHSNRGGAPVGYITELGSVEAASVIYLRLWSNGPDSRAQVRSDFSTALGADLGSKAARSFEQLYSLFASHGRRPLMPPSIERKCLGTV